jgi:hypothetical protein
MVSGRFPRPTAHGPASAPLAPVPPPHDRCRGHGQRPPAQATRGRGTCRGARATAAQSTAPPGKGAPDIGPMDDGQMLGPLGCLPWQTARSAEPIRERPGSGQPATGLVGPPWASVESAPRLHSPEPQRASAPPDLEPPRSGERATGLWWARREPRSKRTPRLHSPGAADSERLARRIGEAWRTDPSDRLNPSGWIC